MKIILLFFVSFSLYSAELTFQGPCDETPFLEGEVTGAGLTAGDITVDFLNLSGTEYIGSRGGINSIQGTPVGMEAIEVVSDTHMRAYGWCYEIDGVQPAEMPDQIKLKGPEHVRWFFAYSTYEDGVWKDYCTPSYQLKSPFICK